MINVTVNGRRDALECGVTVEESIRRLCPEMSAHALGALCGGIVYELSRPLSRDCEMTCLTYEDEEGRRIYERSLRFVMLLALRELFPGQQVRIEHSLGGGIYVKLPGYTMRQEDVQALDETMRRLVREKLPYEKKRWSRSHAIRYFRQTGQQDKVDLLAYRPYDHIYLYTCGGLSDYFYGAMLPDTGRARVFGVKLNSPGFILQLPTPSAPWQISPGAHLPKHLAAFQESSEWCRILSCTNAADLNGLVLSGQLRKFIRVNEALHDKSIAGIAEGIRQAGSRAVMIAGPSSSGKTTFANRLCIHLRVLGLIPRLISLDNFYLPRDQVPVKADGSLDFEDLHALDVPLIQESLKKLLNGEEAVLPVYHFAKDKENTTMTLSLGPNEVLVMEGIHALNPELHRTLEGQRVSKVYISELTCLNLDDHNRIRTTDARLLRRIVRDYQFRATPADATLTMWKNVREGEEKWIFPYQEEADFVFNSVLHYELPFLRNYAYDLLHTIEPENPNYLPARRLIKILHYFMPAPQETLNEIPPLSILREFIGGNTLYLPDDEKTGN